MTASVTLDASAMLALIQSEPGSDVVVAAMEDASEIFVSAVNLCEVATKLIRNGQNDEQVTTWLAPFLAYVIEFDAAQAMLAGGLARSTQPLGLSLGDRACLALAASKGATAMTTDRAWKKLKTKVRIELLR